MVADFDGTYHAILGRPSLTKFKAVPHYSYLVLKMRTEKGVLTIRGNVYTTYTCEEESFKVTCNILDFYENKKYELFKIFPVIV